MSGYIGMRNDPLLIALKDARRMVGYWAMFANDWQQEVSGLQGDLAKLDAIIDSYEHPVVLL